MNLYKIHHELIANRTEDAWYKLRIDGPTYHYRWGWGWNSDGEFSEVIGEHHSHAVCREEPSLTMSWGMDVHPRESRKLSFDWAKDFVNSEVYATWVDFFWNGALIDRVQLLVVDGAHGLIPTPNHEMKHSAFAEAVAFLVHSLEGDISEDSPDKYLNRIGSTAVYDSDREGAGSD